jgi:hypothetical protein
MAIKSARKAIAGRRHGVFVLDMQHAPLTVPYVHGIVDAQALGEIQRREIVGASVKLTLRDHAAIPEQIEAILSHEKPLSRNQELPLTFNLGK